MLTHLDNPDIAKIVAVKSILQQAEKLTGVPWQMIAAVWYRESFSVAPPKTPGGPFQFDPIPSINVLNGLMLDFCPTLDQVVRQYYINTFLTKFDVGAILAACWLRHNCKLDLKTDHTDIAVKDAFYGYNGRAFGPHPESSPYVYNNFDKMHTNMHLRGSIPDGKGGREWIDIIDKRPGAFTVYRQLVDSKV